LKVFQELDGGRVFDSEMQRLESSSSSGKKSKKKNRTRVTDQAYQNYLSRALSFTVGLKEMIEILSRSLSIDIYILKQIRGGVSPIASLCVLTEGNQVAIVLYSDSKVSKDPNDLKISKVYTDPQNFSPVSNGTETTFSFDSSLIQKLQSQIE
jgi:hypothetical protein